MAETTCKGTLESIPFASVDWDKEREKPFLITSAADYNFAWRAASDDSREGDPCCAGIMPPDPETPPALETFFIAEELLLTCWFRLFRSSLNAFVLSSETSESTSPFSSTSVCSREKREIHFA